MVILTAIRERGTKLLAQLPYLPRALALVWSAARYWTVAWGVLLVVQGLLPVATVYLTRQVVDRLAQAVGSSGGRAAVQPRSCRCR